MARGGEREEAREIGDKDRRELAPERGSAQPRERKRVVLSQDGRFERAWLMSGFDPEFLHKPFPRIAVHPERFSLPAVPVELRKVRDQPSPRRDGRSGPWRAGAVG